MVTASSEHAHQNRIKPLLRAAPPRLERPAGGWSLLSQAASDGALVLGRGYAGDPASAVFSAAGDLPTHSRVDREQRVRVQVAHLPANAPQTPVELALVTVAAQEVVEDDRAEA